MGMSGHFEKMVVRLEVDLQLFFGPLYRSTTGCHCIAVAIAAFDLYSLVRLLSRSSVLSL